MHPLENYLKEIRDVRLSGGAVKETSYYGALAALLDQAGGTLRPKVRCIVNLRDTGGGIPDGGFFTRDQFPKPSADEPFEGQIPERGALEVKGLQEDVFRVAESEQVGRYLERYGQVLVTNLRDFVLVGSDHTGQRTMLESFRIGESQSAFLEMCKHPRKTAKERGEPLFEYLKRVLLHPAPLADPKDLAWFLASYARDARKRVEVAGVPSLASLRESLETALGIEFQGERGEHFFQSSLVQTLFYGIFSAWVLWSRGGGEGRFNWRESAWSLRVPMIRALFHQVADPDRLHRLNLVEVLDWTAEALNRVDRTAFFTRFREEHAVQYFYEPFLEAFDPELRRQLGVWYTPPEVVRYMVAKVDYVLRTDLGIADGLADERVVVLDPCCGTGAYLVEVLHRIEETLRARGEDALVPSDLKAAAAERIFGFEIMPAPFVVAHLQLGLLLQQKGAGFGEAERAGIYLTNALTGWVPPKDPKDQIPIGLAELREERSQAAHVKRDAPILVILGNPPYSGYAGLAMGEERDLVDSYRTTKQAPKPKGQGLNDLYVRFFRMAERKITEMDPHKGVVCFISNYSWLDGLSFTGMRERYIDRFDQIDVDSLNGDKYRTGKTTPEGDPDPSIFSTEHNREGIQVGTAIVTLVRNDPHGKTDTIRFRDLWGKGKLQQLAGDGERIRDVEYEEVAPQFGLGYALSTHIAAPGYTVWPRLTELFPEGFPGVQTKRDDVLVDIDRDRLVARMAGYFDAELANDEIASRYPRFMESTARYEPAAVRRYLVERGIINENIVRYCYRPFDLRWIYWEPETKLLGEKSPDYFPQTRHSSIWIEARQKQSKVEFDRGYVTTVLADNFGSGFSSFIPMTLAANQVPRDLFSGVETLDDDVRRIDAEHYYNLSELSLGYLEKIGSVREDAPHLFHHAIAVLHAPAYRKENAGPLRQDWPRIPLPESREQLLASAALGRRIADLLNPEKPVAHVNCGEIRPELAVIAVPTRMDGAPLDGNIGDFNVTARWGYAGARGVTMPGRGKAVEREYTPEERAVIFSARLPPHETRDSALSEFADPNDTDAFELLGHTCYDIYLNGEAYWRCVPARVWDYSLGGYQVIKKWLSYREKALLGRGLKREEVREVMQMARRIAAVLLMNDELDESYRGVMGSEGQFLGSK